jgi:branched-chain amino acid transport system permease protein
MAHRARAVTLLIGFLVLGLVPVLAAAANQPFYLDLFRRIMIFAIAAVSLDLILGFGGMVSFGHAAYLGLGAYAVAIPAFYGIHSGLVQWTLAIVLSGLVALAIGAVSLRTSGVSFIMITLAFAQMLYYLGISIDAWGADDGMRLARRSQFGGVLDLTNAYVFYYVVFAVLVVLLWLGGRLIDARFGVVIRSARSNEPRMRAIGFSTFRYKLTAFAIAGAVCGLAGALLANQTEYLTPSYMHWTRSGDIMVMVILGGMGTLYGPVLGAVVFLLLEDVLSAWTVHWQIVLGPLLVLIVLYARHGLYGRCLSRSSACAVSASGSAGSWPPISSISRWPRARRWPSSGRTAPARRRSSASSLAISRRTRGPSASAARTSHGWRRRRARSAASPARFRSRASSRSSRRSTTSPWPCRRTRATAFGSGPRPARSARCASPHWPSSSRSGSARAQR